MTESDIQAALTEIFRDCFDDPTLVLKPKMSSADIEGWDSARMVHLVLAVEERFGIRMRSREIDGLRHVGDWIRLILEHAKRA